MYGIKIGVWHFFGQMRIVGQIRIQKVTKIPVNVEQKHMFLASFVSTF